MMGLLSALPADRFEQALVPILSSPVADPAEMRCAPEACKGILRCLASSAPVCQTIRPQIFPLAEKLLLVSFSPPKKL